MPRKSNASAAQAEGAVESESQDPSVKSNRQSLGKDAETIGIDVRTHGSIGSGIRI